jgi:hypothetical protein
MVAQGSSLGVAVLISESLAATASPSTRGGTRVLSAGGAWIDPVPGVEPLALCSTSDRRFAHPTLARTKKAVKNAIVRVGRIITAYPIRFPSA